MELPECAGSAAGSGRGPCASGAAGAAESPLGRMVCTKSNVPFATARSTMATAYWRNLSSSLQELGEHV
jgi:hypothetical protein